MTLEAADLLVELGQAPLDRASGVPLYLQAAAALERALRRQPTPTGAPLPAEGDLASAFRISRPTLRHAIRHLSERNVVTVRRGVGAFSTLGEVTRHPRASSLHSDLLKEGRRPSTTVLSFGDAMIDAETASLLGAPSTSPVYQIERLRSADDQPLAIMESCIVRVPELRIDPEELRDGSLYDVIAARTGAPLTHGRETITAALATDRQAALLGLAQPAAIMRLDRLTWDSMGRGIERSTNWYAHSRMEIPLNLEPLTNDS